MGEDREPWSRAVAFLKPERTFSGVERFGAVAGGRRGEGNPGRGYGAPHSRRYEGARVAAQLAMKGIVKRLIAVVVLALAVTLGCLGLKPAGATGPNVCSLITKQEASKILGSNVVKTVRRTDASGGQECRYRTKKFTAKRLRRFDAPLGLTLSWVPLTPELRQQIDDQKFDLDSIDGLGDEAYFDSTHVLAIRGQNVLTSSVVNWETGIETLHAKGERAMRLALARLPTG
jgi:hypothetical protein